MVLTALVPLVTLVKASAIGVHVRPISDDYCQVAWVKVDGFWGLVQHYWELNGRVGNALVATLIHLVPGGIQVLPATVAAAAVAASGVLTARLLDVNGLAVPRAAVAAAAIATSCAVILREGANFYQTFLWAPGEITHTLSWVLAAALAAMAVSTRSRFERALLWPALLLGGLLLGTLTEVLSALTCALLALLVIARFVHRHRLGRYDALAVFAAAWVGVGLLVLLSSPGLARRRGAASPLDPAVVRASLRIWPDVLLHSLVQPWIVVPPVAGLLLGVLARTPSAEPGVPRRALLGWSAVALGISLVGGSLLTVDADTTGFGARGALNYPRTWLDFMVATAFCLVLVGVLAGRAIAQQSPAGRGLALVVVVTPLAVAAVGAAQYSHVSTVEQATRERAAAWDAQDRAIRAQVAGGARRVVYVSWPIADLSEPFAQDGRPTFSRGCAATYFGVDRLIPPPAPGK